jgi:signal peptidase I
LSSSNAGRAIAQVVLILVLVAAAAYLINSDAAGVQVYNVYPTISMLPTLEVGDLVVVHSVPFDTIKQGDVIVYARPDSSGVCTSASEVIVHRVVNVTQLGLITQGDDRTTNPSPDEVYTTSGWVGWPPVPADCVKGVVVVAIPYLGRITEAFPPPYNYLLVVVILAFVFALEFRPKRAEQGGEGDGSTAPETSPSGDADWGSEP